jgi:hypothetical protein
MKEQERRIWKIRDLIQRLEDVKDKITDFLEKRADLDPSTRSMWIGDTKEMYYKMVAAWEMLRAASETEAEPAKKMEHGNACRDLLEGAESRLEQCSSEIGSVREGEFNRLEPELREAFHACRQAIMAEREALFPQKAEKALKRVLKKSDSEYHLPCSICGEASAVIKVGIPMWGDAEDLIYSGITHSRAIGLKYAGRIFHLLDDDDIRGVHDFFVSHRIEEDGIDAYCPTCDAVYCRTHYRVSEIWDHGFYDYAEGTCPKGHTREIDD